MEETKRWAISLMLFTTLLTSIAQIFLKKGAAHLDIHLFALLTNYPLLIGCLLYGTAAILMIIAFRGGELSVLYPLISTSYIWVAILAWYYFGEALSLAKIIGIVSIIIGVTFIGVGSRKKGVAPV